jgi:hypothetical protein
MPDAPRSHPFATVVENLAPLVGVLFFGWSVAPVMVVYWVENGLKGLETAARMVLFPGPGGLGPGQPIGLSMRDSLRTLSRELIARSPGAEGTPTSPEAAPIVRLPIAARLGVSAFFLVHFGIFWVVHGVFVFALFVGNSRFGGLDLPGSAALPTGQVALAAGLVAAAVVASIFRDATRPGDRTGPPAFALMGLAYGRMVVLHVALILGGFGLMMLGSPTPALVLLIVLKTAAELGASRLADRPRSA